MRQFRLVALVALSALLGACGGSGSGAAAPSITPAETPGTTPAPTDGSAFPSASADPRAALSGSTLADSTNYRDAAGETSFRSPTQNICATDAIASGAKPLSYGQHEFFSQ